MATKYGSGASGLQSAIPTLVEQGQMSGRVHVHYDEYVLSATNTLTSGDVIVLGGLLPANARVIDVYVDSADLDSGSTGAFTSGWAASAQLDSSGSAVEAGSSAGFLSSVDVHTAGKVLMMHDLLQSNVAGKFKKFTAAVQPQLAVTGTGDATSGTIRHCIKYIID